MPNYQLGKIYKLVSLHTNKIYIGSTTQKYLCQRFANHKYDYSRYLAGEFNYMTSFELFKLGAVKIVLLEAFPCNSPDELHARERYYIESLNCVNKIIPGRSEMEWRETNKEKIAEYKKQYQKEYGQNNREKIAEYQKEYGKKNREKLTLYRKKWCEANKKAEIEETCNDSKKNES